MNKKTKLYLGIGLIAVAGFLIWKQNQKKNLAGATSLLYANEGDGGTPTGGGASTLPAQACNGYTEGHACAFISPRTGNAIFGRCKASSGGALSCV